MITRLSLRNYKCFPELNVELPRFCAIVGPNNSGKSSVLRALEQLGMTVKADLPHVFKEPESVRSLAWGGAADTKITFGASILDPSSSGVHYELTIAAPDESGRAFLWSDLVRIEDPASDHVAVERGSPYSSLRHWKAGKSGAHILVHQLISILTGTLKVRLDASHLAAPCPIEEGERGRTDPNGYGLPAVLDFRKGERLELFLKIQDALSNAFPEIKEIVVRKKVLRDEQQTQTHATLAFRTKAGFEIPAQLASEGMLLYLGYLTLLYTEKAPHQLLIEEPENGNHPKRLGQIVDVLRKISSGAGGARPTQIIMTTHSPYMLDFLQPEEVLIATREPGGAARIDPLTNAPHLAERLQDFSVGELIFNVGEEALAGRGRSGQ
jgi:predicted ATPase